ncbi:MAG: rhodanese-like domain-containing protein [Spirochaetota bacterium]
MKGSAVRRALETSIVLAAFLLAVHPAAGQSGLEVPEIEELEQVYNHLLIMPETLMYRIMDGDRGFVLYDIRNPAAFRSGHVAGAVNLPWESGEFQRTRDFPRDRELLLISRDGEDALRALHLLVMAGFERVYSVEGGMENWMYGDYLVSGP